MNPLVIKLGGRALDRPQAVFELAADLRALARPAVLVHGGGAEVSAWCERLGIESTFSNGLRVTDERTLEVATAVLAGLANKRLVAALRSRGVDAVGLAALDGGLTRVAPHRDATRLGEVGEICAVDGAWLERLMSEGRFPVLASIGADGERLLNLNADDLAAAVAGALGARLLLFSDVEGVRLEGRVARELDGAALASALAGAEVSDGMTAKLRAALAALEMNVPEIWIARWSGEGALSALLDRHAHGTRIAAAPALSGGLHA